MLPYFLKNRSPTPSPYTKFLAERIALDTQNQYFIATHNPYFLFPILEKTPKNEVNLIATTYEEEQTLIRVLSEDQIAEVYDLDSSVFFNLEKFFNK